MMAQKTYDASLHTLVQYPPNSTPKLLHATAATDLASQEISITIASFQIASNKIPHIVNTPDMSSSKSRFNAQKEFKLQQIPSHYIPLYKCFILPILFLTNTLCQYMTALKQMPPLMNQFLEVNLICSKIVEITMFLA